MARNVVLAKVANCRSVLARGIRDHGNKLDRDCVQKAYHRLANIGRRLLKAGNTDLVRGLEGEAANTYFGAFGQLTVTNQDSFSFSERTRRPPLDRMNALLSFLYVMLAHDTESALECTGLDPQVGFLHRERPGRASLALDLMEELRPVVADRLALTLINRQQVNPGKFTIQESGAVLMDDETRKTVLKAYRQHRKGHLDMLTPANLYRYPPQALGSHMF